MKKRSVFVFALVLVLGGCYSDNKYRAAGSPLNGDAYKIEVEILGERSADDRFLMGVSVIGSLGKLDWNSAMEGNGIKPVLPSGGSGEVGLSVFMESSSTLLVFKNERVVVTCAVSGYEDDERAGSVCRDIILAEIEKKS